MVTGQRLAALGVLVRVEALVRVGAQARVGALVQPEAPAPAKGGPTAGQIRKAGGFWLHSASKHRFFPHVEMVTNGTYH